MDSTIIKVKFNNFCKLFPIPENFTKFIEIISQKFNIKNFDIKDYRITFNDNENDLILIETNFDYEILKSFKNKQIKLNLIKINQKEEELNNNNNNNINKEEEENWRGKNFNKNFWDKKFNNNNNENSSSSSSNDDKKFPQKFNFPFAHRYFFHPPFFHNPKFRKHPKKCFFQQQIQNKNNEKMKKNSNEIFENINYHIKKDNKDLSMLITNQNLFFKFLEKSAEKMEIKLFLFNNGNQNWPENVYLINDEKYSALKGEKIKINKIIKVNELCEINVVLNTKDVKKGKYLTVWNLVTENGEKIGDTIFMKIKVCVKKERKDKKNIKNENNENNNNENNNNENNNENSFNKENSTIKSEDIKFDNFENVNK